MNCTYSTKKLWFLEAEIFKSDDGAKCLCYGRVNGVFLGQVCTRKKYKTIKKKNKKKKRPLPADALKDWYFLPYHKHISKSQNRKLIIFYISRKILRTVNVSLSVGWNNMVWVQGYVFPISLICFKVFCYLHRFLKGTNWKLCQRF